MPRRARGRTGAPSSAAGQWKSGASWGRLSSVCSFFFQAEDGIRGFHVTGVQTCALPILLDAAYPAERVLGYVEVHIEQGPVLDSRDLPLGLVTAIIGQSRMWFRFEGKAGHAGTLPMELRQDALAAAAEFVVEVEKYARSVDGLRATVGSLTVTPGAVNVVPGGVRLSLDFRHADNAVRQLAMQALLQRAAEAGDRRDVRCRMELSEDYASVP